MITTKHQKLFIDKVNSSLINQLQTKDYPDIYLCYLIDHLSYFLKIYTCVLNKSLKLAQLEMSEASVVDLGSGNGILGLFAKYCGFKEVYLNDIDKDFIKASKDLANQLSVFPTDYIEGDASSIYNYFKDKKAPDIFVGTDMIEHVYDLNIFFDKLFACRGIKAFVFTTACNPLNIWKVRLLRKIQYNDEYKGGTPDEYLLYGSKAMIPFVDMRKDIISKAYPISEPALTQLAVLTRGLHKEDVEKVASEYSQTGKLPDPPADKYNTCNPLTGSWSERILPFSTYKQILLKYNFNLFVEAGYYDDSKKGFKKFILKIANILISVFGIRIAPFVFLSAKKIN
jgi:hypothetical protein